jgi:hypothetical protein
MMRTHALTLAVALLALAGIAGAPQADTGRQAPTAPPPAHQAPGAAGPSQPSADSMGVSLKAIRTQLQQAPAPRTPTGSGMRYDFFVDVLGIRPAIDYRGDFDLSLKGGVRWGAPTHQEILNAMSPYWVNGARPVGSGVDLLAAARKKK